MRTITRIAAFILCTLLPGLLPAADAVTFDFTERVRLPDGKQQDVEVKLSPRDMKIFDLGEGYTLEVTAPDIDTDVQQSTIILKRKIDATDIAIHTAIQRIYDHMPIPNGYVICGDAVRFLSPAPEKLPGCE